MAETRKAVFLALLEEWRELEISQIDERGNPTTELAGVPDHFEEWLRRFDRALP